MEMIGGNMEFTQSSDSLLGGSDFQTLAVHVGDKGAGKYFSIGTLEWSFDTIEELVEILTKVKTAFEVTK